MDIKVKALLAIAPFGIAIAAGVCLTMPAFEEYNTKSATVDEKKHEQEELVTKLNGKAKLTREKVQIEASVAKLRNNVPKKPDIELLNIDLEKMCDESGLDLVSVGEPDKETLKKAGLEEDANQQTSAQGLKKGLKTMVGTAQGASAATGAAASSAAGAAAVSATSTAPGAAGAGAKKAAPDTGLARVVVRVRAIGDYAGLTDLVKKLETYERVVTISELKATLPKAEKVDKDKRVELPDETPPQEGDAQGDWRRMNCTFLLTAYYLP